MGIRKKAVKDYIAKKTVSIDQLIDEDFSLEELNAIVTLAPCFRGKYTREKMKETKTYGEYGDNSKLLTRK